MIFKKIINKNFYILLFLILTIGIYFRLNFYNDGIWPDEWISFYISVSDLDFLEKLNLHLAREGSSPINLIFNNIIYFFVGYNYQNFELSFLVINIISILFFLQITKQKEKKLLILFLLSLNPMLIYYSGEIRFYTLSVLFSILSIIFFFKLQNFNSKLNILAFTIFTLISLLTNIYSISLLLSYFIYNFFKKNNKFFYIILFLIFIFFLILNFSYFEKMVIDYFSGSYGVAGNIDRKFFLGYFFNIFFGNILLGAFFLILFATSPLFFKLDAYNNDKLFLFYIIIFSSYLIPIFFFLLGKNVTFPRHLIFLVPFIIYILTSSLFSIKNKYFKRTLIISVIILSFYSNTFSDRPFMQIKPNPDGVLKILNSQNLKKLLIHGIPENANSSDIIERKKIYCYGSGCAYENLVFLYSKNFDIDKIDLIFHDNYLHENEFWSICLHLPSYRGDNTKENELKNCYRNLDHIEKSHYQVKNFINNEFNLTLYKSR